MRYLFFIVFTFFTGSVLNLILSQGVVTGNVTDKNTHEPLHGVYVIFNKGKGTTTDSTGNYIIKTEASTLNINFQFIGYRTVKRTVHMNPGDTIELSVEMDMELKEIGQIVVSANKTEQKISELTVSMDVIKSSDFLRSHINDTRELINKTPGIEVLDGQASIRGGTGVSYGVGSRVLALIDGLPVLSPDAGSIKWQFLPLENISQVEIIKGASSVLYGSSALNGIINFRTADAGLVPETRFFAEAGIYDIPRNKKWKWWDSPRIFENISFSHLQKQGRTDVGLALNIFDNNSYRKYNDELTGRVSLRLKHHSDKFRGLAYGMNINSGYSKKTDFILWENADSGALKQDTSSVSRLNGTFVAFDPYVTYKTNGKTGHDLRMRFLSASNRFPERDENNSNAISLYTEYQFRYKFSDFINIAAGMVGNYNRIISNFYGNHEGKNFAGFTQVEAIPVRKLKVSAGIRIEHHSLDGINDRVVPIFRTGINWQAAEYTFIRASFGQGYRYPSVAEKYAETTLGSIRIIPNPDIEPESGWSSEVGLKQGVLIGKTKGHADLSFFLSQNNDLIEFELVTNPYLGFRARNVEQSRIYGYEIEFLLDRRSGGFNSSLSGGYTYIYPVEINTDNFLKYRRKHSLKISTVASYKKLELGLTLFGRSRILNIDNVFLHELTRENILPGFYDYWQEKNTGYFLLDGNIGYKLSKRFTISLAVKNITNTEYMGRPGDIQPQRNISLRFSGYL